MSPDDPGEREAWNRLVLAQPQPHLLQSYEWGEIKARHGWRPYRLRLAAGAASLLVRRAGPLRVAYAPKAPLCHWDRLEALETCLAELEEAARRERAIFLKVDPDLPAGHPGQEVLRRRGWRPSPSQIQFKNTLLIDLAQNEDELMSVMKPKTRYNVRLAGRRGVEVRSLGEESLPRFYEMYRETAQRQGFPIRPWGYYRTAWETLMRAGLGALLWAFREDRALAALFIAAFGPRAYYLYGASIEDGREHMPTHLLQWEAIRWAKERGCAVYDLWGAPHELQEGDPMWGVHRFKEGFGGRLFLGTGAWDYVLSRPGYWLYQQVIPRLLALSRGRQLGGAQ